MCISAETKHYRNIYKNEPKIIRHRQAFESLKLNELDIGRFRRIFNKIDKDRSGTIELLELLMYLDIERTPFTKRVFSIFDDDGSNTVDFKEFVLALWNYCTLGKSTLVLFAFDVYDRDTSGELSSDEVKVMLQDVYGDSYDRSAHAKAIVSKIDDIAGPGFGVDVDSFRSFCGKHQALLYPAFEMQRMIQQKILGEEFWNLLSLRRVELSKGTYIPIAEFMQIHVNKDVYHKHVKTAFIKSRKGGKESAKIDKNIKSVIGATGTKSARLNRASLRGERPNPQNNNLMPKISENDSEQKMVDEIVGLKGSLSVKPRRNAAANININQIASEKHARNSHTGFHHAAIEGTTTMPKRGRHTLIF